MQSILAADINYKGDKKSSLLITVFYFVLMVIGATHHELWLDEAQHILLGQESESIVELWYNARYEGHPLLWNVLILLLSKATKSVLAVQLLNVCICCASVYIILRRSPFPLLFNLLIVFGYFLGYEYSVITRNYSLCVLWSVLSIAELCKPEPKPLRLIVFLLLLFLSHLFGCFVGLSLILLYLFTGKFTRRKVITAVILLLSTFIIILVHVPPDDHFLYQYNAHPILSIFRAKKMIAFFTGGIVPFPDLCQANFWGNQLFSGRYKIIGLLLAAGFFVTVFKYLQGNRKILVALGIAIIPMILFVWISPMTPSARHGGFIMLVTLVVCWYFRAKEYKMGRRMWSRILIAICILQLTAGMIMYAMDIRRPFSNARTIAMKLNSYPENNINVILSHFTAGPAVNLYSTHHLQYVEQTGNDKFCRWNTSPLFLDSIQKASRIRSLIKTDKINLLILTLRNNDTDNQTLRQISDLKPKLILKTQGSVIRSEEYELYQIAK